MADRSRRDEGDPELERKMREYHRKGGPQGGDAAKNLEGEIAGRAISKDNTLKKARPKNR